MAVYAENSFSFPSGHATIGVAFYGFVGYVLMRFAKSWNMKVNIFFATILIIIAIGVSRVYLGVHYISDVWSGYLVGSMWLIIAISFSEWFEHLNPNPQIAPPVAAARQLSWSLISLAFLFYTGFAMIYQPQPATVSAGKEVIISKSTDIFTSDKLKYTETLLGDRQEPLNLIILAKDNSVLLDALQEENWESTGEAGIPSFPETIAALILKKPYTAPISPSFWDTAPPDLSLVKIYGEIWFSRAHYIKIWRTRYLMENGDRVYVAMANANDGFKWGIIPKILPDLDKEREYLFEELNSAGQIKSHRKVQLVPSMIGENFMGDQFFTDGKAYIISL
jgi:undecaprenyl-diphosphatase